MVKTKKRLKGIPKGRPKLTSGFTRDVKQALKLGKKITGRRPVKIPKAKRLRKGGRR